ncbi:MAG: sugar phosphate isomerase/epimerase [Phycisphaeraceae bacterium]|nr:sugar phosphate isomerase/epimerase [Phycisphaeraceae bacterium]
MRLSVSTYSLARWRREQNKSYEDTISFYAHEAKVKGVEISGLDDKAKKDPIARAAELRRHAEKAGMKVSGYCVGAELMVPLDEQKKAVEQLKREVDIAATLGVASMRHDVTRGFDKWTSYTGPKTLAALLKHIVPAIREVADYAQAKGVKTTLENHGFYMQASERVEKLLKAVKHPNFALTLDMGNFLCVNENPVKAVTRCAKYAVMAHVKDFHVRAKKTTPPSGWFATPTPIALRGAIVGHGVIDIPAELKLLKKANYRGWLSLEFEGMEDPTQGVLLGLDYLRREMSQLSVLEG